MIKVEELKQCKNANEDLIQVVKEKLSELFSDYEEHNHMEDNFGFEYSRVHYDVISVDESDWSDEGKYQYQEITYQLVSFDKDFKPYPCEKNIIDKFDLLLNTSVTRSGSYFTDYNYIYDKPTIKIAIIEHIPKQIIPAHDEVKFVDR